MSEKGKMWDRINKNSDDIKEILNKDNISDAKKNKDKFLTKHKDIIPIVISFASLITTIIIAFCFTRQQLELSKAQKQISDTQLEISESNKMLTENNQNLVYDTQIDIGNLLSSGSVSMEDNTTEVKIKFKVTPTIKQGQIKAVYSYTFSDDLRDLSNLNVSEVNEITANYSIKGDAEEIQKSILDMLILYVDYNDRIYYDYVFFVPEYTKHEVTENINETETKTIGLELINLKYNILNQYELINKKDYTAISKKNSGFEFMFHEDLLENVKKVKKYIIQNLT